MGRLPNLSPKKVVTALKRGSFVFHHQRGSHAYFWHSEKGLMTSVPIHSGDVDRGLLKKIIKRAGLSENEFRDLL
jgi:predicted RNA binding protein YcfA (HicA-like mRNA interferase family)